MKFLVVILILSVTILHTEAKPTSQQESQIKLQGKYRQTFFDTSRSNSTAQESQSDEILIPSEYHNHPDIDFRIF